MTRVDFEKTINELMRYCENRGNWGIDKIQPFISENSRVLDAGCGRGYVLNRIQTVKNGNKVGIDLYNQPKSADPYRTIPKQDFEFIIGDLNKMPFKANSFDLIISTHVIEHLTKADGEELMKSFSKLLKNGGVVYIQTPNRKRLTNMLGSILKKVLKKNPFYLVRDQTKELKQYYENRPRILTHEHEYSFYELITLIDRHFTIIDSGGIVFNWFAFTKPIALMRLFLPRRVNEALLSSFDRVIDIIGLNRFKSPVFVLAQKEGLK